MYHLRSILLRVALFCLEKIFSYPILSRFLGCRHSINTVVKGFIMFRKSKIRIICPFSNNLCHSNGCTSKYSDDSSRKNKTYTTMTACHSNNFLSNDRYIAEQFCYNKVKREGRQLYLTLKN